MALEKLEVAIIQHQMNLKKSKSDMNKIISEKEAECDQIRLSTQKSVNEIQMKLECEIRSRSEAVKEKKSQGCNFEEIFEAIFLYPCKILVNLIVISLNKTRNFNFKR